jgi:hypothetical protein
VGAILATSIYLGTLALQARRSWADYRAEAEQEQWRAEAAAEFASKVGKQADQAGREGRIAESEHLARIMRWSLQEESRHRLKARELLGRWW